VLASVMTLKLLSLKVTSWAIVGGTRAFRPRRSSFITGPDGTDSLRSSGWAAAPRAAPTLEIDYKNDFESG
jgi:hypothetical protein